MDLPVFLTLICFSRPQDSKECVKPRAFVALQSPLVVHRNYILLSALFLANIVPILHVSYTYGMLWSLAVEDHFILCNLWQCVLLSRARCCLSPLGLSRCRPSCAPYGFETRCPKGSENSRGSLQTAWRWALASLPLSGNPGASEGICSGSRLGLFPAPL